MTQFAAPKPELAAFLTAHRTLHDLPTPTALVTGPSILGHAASRCQVVNTEVVCNADANY